MANDLEEFEHVCTRADMVAAPEVAEYWLQLPYSRPPLSLNDRLHWRTTAAIRRTVKDAAHQLALIEQLPRPVASAVVTLVYNPPDRRRRDEDNLFATLKPAIDGLVRYGLVVDDDSQHISSRCRIGEARKPGQVWLCVEIPA